MSDKNSHDLSREEWLRRAGQTNSGENNSYQDEFSRRAVEGLRYANSRESLQEALQRLDRYAGQKTQSSGNTARRRSLVPRWLGLVAGVLLIVAAAIFVWTDAPHPSPSLFEEYFAPIPSAIPLTGNLRNPEKGYDLKQRGLQDYENEQYAEAIEKFQQYLTSNSEDNGLRLYLGIALLAEGQSNTAAEELEIAYHQPQSENYRYPALWYLALAHLQLDEPQQAVLYLKDLAMQTQNTFYREQAEKLLEAISSRDDATK